MTIADLGIYGAKEMLALDPSELAEKKSRLGFNAEHLTCSDVFGGEKGVFYFRTEIAESVPRDFLAEYLPEAKKRGIRVLIYYNVHWIQTQFGLRHPEWLQRRSGEKVIDDLYGSGCAPCVNSPWRDWSFQGLRDLAAYDIDGVFLDGPIFAPGACYCVHCRELFREGYGAELPAEEDWRDQNWRNFIEFRYDSIAAYLRDSERVLKAAKPSAIIYMNCTGLGPGWPAARDNRRLMPFQDILGAEGGFVYYDLRTAPLWKPGMAAKLLETQSGGKPRVIFIAGANKGWDEYLLPPTETRLLYADALANGANPWYGIPRKLAGRPGALAAGKMNRFLLENAEYFVGSQRHSKVALLWSSRTADYYRSSVPVTDFTPQGEKLGRRQAAGNFSKSFVGCYEAMVRSHVPFDIMDESSIVSGALGSYDLVVLPNCACLSEGEAALIREYVKGGGNLASSHEVSLYDESGERLDGFRLKGTLGVDLEGGTFGPMKLDYITVTDPELAACLSAEVLPCPIYGTQVAPSTAIPLAIYHEKMPARYVELPPLSANPAILVNQWGRGRSLYFAGSFFEHYTEYHNPDYRRILASAVSTMSRPVLTLANCPRSVEVVARRQIEEKRLLVHLVNFTAEMTRPMESVIPISGARLTIQNDGIAKAKALKANMDLALETIDGGVVVEVPSFEEYEVIALEPFNEGM